MQPPYPQPPPPVAPSRRQGRAALVVVVIVGAVFLVLLLAAAVVLTVDRQSPPESAGGPVKGSLQFRPVLTVAPGPCPAGETTRVTSTENCYELGDGMTIAAVKRIALQPPDAQSGRTSYSVGVTLGPDDAKHLGILTTGLAPQQPPRNQLAIVVNGRVVSAPAVAEPILGGILEITGNFSRPQAQKYVDLVQR